MTNARALSRLSVLFTLFCLPNFVFANFSSNVSGNLTASVNLSSGNLGSLEILTTSIDAVLFDQEYALQLLAQGGSGMYEWSVATGTLPPGFSLNSETGVLSGNFNYATLTQFDPYVFTIRLSDQCFPFTDSDNTVYTLPDATQAFSLGPDPDDYCWNVYQSGGIWNSRSLNNSDFVYTFFEGVGVDIYFGTEYIGLDLPSEISIDNVVVTPVAVNSNVPDPSLWQSNGATVFTRYRLAEDLEFGDHVLKIVAPSSGNRQVAFQNLEVQQVSNNVNYYVSKNVTPSNSLYRCSAQRADLPALSIVPTLVLQNNTLTVSDLPAGIEASTTTATNTTTTTNTIVSDNLISSDNTTVSANVAKPRFAVAEEYVVFLEVYDADSNRIDTIFKNFDGGITLPENGTKVKLAYLNKSEPRERYESVEEPIETLVAKASTSNSSAAASSGGGGGCLIR